MPEPIQTSVSIMMMFVAGVTALPITKTTNTNRQSTKYLLYLWRVHKKGHIRFRHQSNFFVNFSFLKIKLGAIYSLTLWYDNFPTNGFLSIF